jgi:hypothetical protein
MITIQPSILVNKVEKIAKQKQIIFTVEDYIKSFVCQKCHCTKGRKPNPEFANLPKELICACGKKASTNAYQLKAKAKKNNTTIDEIIKNYRCQTCCPILRGKRKQTLEEKAYNAKTKAIHKEKRKAAKIEQKAARKIEHDKQKIITNSMPKRGRGRPKKILTFTE